MSQTSMIETSTTLALTRFLDVNVARSKLIMANLANIDTPGYRTRDLNFHAEMNRASFEASEAESGELSYAAYAPVAHPVRGLVERPDGNNVSVEREGLLLAETQMKFNLGVQLLKDEFHTISQAINSGGASS
ncbi:MAG TPA: flagellar basal body rod protein FlgB [Terriglobales bacterium]|nr:flagellar basal body rod protein FlgB [Terriglobales bacterium]